MMAACAVEFCLGRRNYITGMCADWLIGIWPDLHGAAKTAIHRAVERAYADFHERDRPGALGMAEDREQWDRVRKLWQP